MKTVFCGGGTAGHVTPNLALIDLLQDSTNFYIGTNGMEKTLTAPYLQNGKIAEFCEISATKFRRKFTLKNLLLPFALSKSVREAKNHLKRIKPNVVFSKGGYVGLPVVMAAKSLKIPVIIHESDMSLGLANKISARYADKLLTAYPCHKKATVVGAIIRKQTISGNRANGLSTMGFDGSKPVLLVMGGSLGAKALNEAICQNKNLSEKFDIFVICGKGKTVQCDFVRQAEFVSNIGDIFAATTVCITRAGSNSLAELTLAQVPFVSVPLTKCSRGEQVKNARWFAEKGCGLSVSEDSLEQKIPRYISDVFDNRYNIQAKQRLQSGLYGTDKVIEEISNYRVQNE
ncbi:MAG: UDP-N-acetylglucosamine--N-acetylmuramyl-(pentapeptide) pyrophosphoryl-undecaprenol N-acetylglucosamine transferase [Corallococcus sp.]|nr:UDP-N-acetylglucosamine--N-acetylmuramyl-(pentapeptide) pyrophosphoryl-undecaprenol N-acetylglucosamine transferase [Corallococcus sp.]MCM1359222.1 UDP-N-acetylglucosamine--N-acetylmuramyl-(pentapeptide) pyrophosphoryl-undecaprenol N-acetylglucosamine transferase [Corallococcus sp.]MCM1394612.1 UDP-N-acetylglucosamine--N-acetylmuramyl-(pentapeptide) pyrophosphoryl-undecaprenol N-acetylglucosamine transferase [Corallococcus sp.]